MKMSLSKVEESPNGEWENAKPYTSIPGPSKLELIKSFIPGGKHRQVPQKLNLNVNLIIFEF